MSLSPTILKCLKSFSTLNTSTLEDWNVHCLWNVLRSIWHLGCQGCPEYLEFLDLGSGVSMSCFCNFSLNVTVLSQQAEIADSPFVARIPSRPVRRLANATSLIKNAIATNGTPILLVPQNV